LTQFVSSASREFRGQYCILRGLTAGSIGQEVDLADQKIDEALVFARKADTTD